MSKAGARNANNGAARLQRTLTSARNIAVCYAGTLTEGGVFLLLTPFLVRRLGIAAFGLWCLATALAEALQFFDLGLREAVTKFTAGLQAKEDAEGVKRLADTSLLIYLLIAVAALAVLAAVLWLALPFLLEEPGDLEILRKILLLLGLLSVVSLPAGIAGSILEGFSRFDLVNLFRVGWAFLRLVLIVIALQFDTGLLGVAVAELSARLLLILARWTAVYRLAPILLPVPRLHRGEFRKLLGFGSWNAVRHGAEIAATRLCEPILAAFSGPAAVGAFFAGRRLASVPAEVIAPMAGVVFPLSSEMDAAGREEALRQMLLKATKISFFIGVPMAMVLGIGAAPIQANWLGGRAPEAEPVLAVFSVVFVIVAGCLPAESVLLGTGRTRLLAVAGAVQMLITLGLGIYLTRRYGAVGLAVSSLVAVVFVQAAVQIPVAARACGVGLLLLVRRTLVPPLLAGVPVAVIAFYLRDLLAVGGLAGIGVWAGGAMATYTLLYWWFGLDQEERRFFRRHLERLLRPASEAP